MAAGPAIRVALIHNEVTPYRLPLFAALAERYDLTVIFCSGVPDTRRWADQTDMLRSASFRAVHPRFRRVGHLVINRGIVRALRELDVDVIVVADNDENAITLLLACLSAWRRRLPIVVWSEHVPGALPAGRGGSLRSIVLGALRVAYRKVLYRRAGVFVSMSGRESDRFLEQRIGTSKPRFSGTQVMPAELLPELPAEHEFGHGYVAFIGYLRAEKGVDLLISAFRRVPNPEARLLIAGAGPLLEQLEELAGGDPRIRFLGYVDGPRKADFLSRAGLVVVPSIYEPWGLVVNEAIAYGTPAACSTAVTARALAGCDPELVFHSGDVDSLAEVLRRSLDEPDLLEHARALITPEARAAATDPRVGVRHLVEAIDSTS